MILLLFPLILNYHILMMLKSKKIINRMYIRIITTIISIIIQHTSNKRAVVVYIQVCKECNHLQLFIRLPICINKWCGSKGSFLYKHSIVSLKKSKHLSGSRSSSSSISSCNRSSNRCSCCNVWRIIKHIKHQLWIDLRLKLKFLLLRSALRGIFYITFVAI